MSEASVGSIIGYLKLDRSDWDAELNAAGRKADDLARHNPNIKIQTNAPSAIAQLAAVSAAVRRLQDAQGAENVAQAKLTDLQHRGNASAGQLAAAEERLQRAHRATAAATIQLANAHDANDRAMRKAATETRTAGDASEKSSFQMHALRDALLLIGPAAVPIAAVAGGAILGLVPVAAAAILGIKGITQEYQSGALAGTQYGADIKSLADEFTNLKQTAANGLLGGVDQAIQSSQPLFGALNQDIGTLSSQLGAIVAGAAPALLTILNALNPLFVTFGQLLSDGATKLEHWATSSGGIEKFVAYVQAELPTVVTALGQLVETAARLLTAFAPAGNAILTILGGLASAINAIPTPVLQGLVPVALALYAAFRGYGAITAAVTGVSAAVNAMKAPFVSTAAQAEASSLAIQAAAAQEAAAVAASNAAMAAAAAESAVSIAAATEGTGSVLAAGATAAAEAAIEESAAFQATAVAAMAASEEISASAIAAAETVAAEGKAASIGWAGMLGPIGAVAIGVGILAATFLTSKKDAQDAAEAANSYAQSVKTSTNALNLSNIQQTNANLAKKGALDLFAKLTAANSHLGVSQIDLTTAVNGTQQQFDSLTHALVRGSLGSAKQEIAAGKLVDILKTQRKGLQEQILTQTQLNSINAASAGISDSQAVAAARLFGLTGTDGVAAYLAAKQATDQATTSAKAQTLQYQLDNDAASLLAQTLDKLSGKNLGYAQALNQFQQSLVNMAKHTTTADAAVKGLSSSAIKNRGDLLTLVTGAQQTAEAYGKMKGSSEAGRRELIKLRQQIIDNAVAHGENRKAVTDYIDTVLKIPKSVPPTKLQLDQAALAKAKQDIADMQALLNRIANGTYVAHVTATGSVNVSGAGSKGSQFSGHYAAGSGGVPDGWFTMGERGYELGHKDGNRLSIYSHEQAVKMTGQATVPGYANGSDVVSLTPKKSKAKAKGGGKSSGGGKGRTRSTVAVTVNASDLTSFLRALPTFVSNAATAISDQFGQLISKVSQAGGGHRLVDRLKRENGELVGLVRDREGVEKRLAAAQTALNNAVQKYNSERSSVAGAVTGSFNISSAGDAGPTTSSKGFASGVAGVSTSITSTTAGAVGVASILQQVTRAAYNARRFYGLLKDLSRRGLSKVLLDQLAQAGPSALPQAEALDKATSGQLSQINREEGSLIQNANAAGKFMADTMDGAGVQAALGLVHGLESQDKALGLAMKHLADVMVKQIRKELKIHSPSLVMHELGAFTGQGFANGIGSQAPAVRSQSMRLASSAVPSISRPSIGGQQSGGLQLVQHIYPQPEQSPMAIAKAAAGEQLWALRR